MVLLPTEIPHPPESSQPANLTQICTQIVTIQERIEWLVQGTTVRNSVLYIKYTDELISVLHNIFPLLRTLRETELDEALWVLCWCIASYRPEHSMIIIGIQARLQWIVENRKKEGTLSKTEEVYFQEAQNELEKITVI